MDENKKYYCTNCHTIQGYSQLNKCVICKGQCELITIDEKIISEWTLGIEPVKVIKIPRTGDRVSKGPRIIYFWKFSA